MPSDIRSFFGPKGGSAPKPAPRKAEELAKSKRTSKLSHLRFNSEKCINHSIEGRKVVEDSEDDDEEPVEYVILMFFVYQV